jgi:hypothetical protein
MRSGPIASFSPALRCGLQNLQQATAGVIAKYLGIADVSPQSVDALMAAYIHHLEDRSTARCGWRKKTRSQRVTAKFGSIQTAQPSTPLLPITSY